MCRSVPQIDATFPLTNTSVRPKAGIFSWRTSAPGAASGFTTASIVSAMIATYQFAVKIETKHKTYDSTPRANCGFAGPFSSVVVADTVGAYVQCLVAMAGCHCRVRGL